MKKLRFMCMVIAIMLVVLPLTGCDMTATKGTGEDKTKSEILNDQKTQTGNATSSSQRSIKIKFWNGFTSTDGQILREIFNRFNEQNDKGIYVEMDIMPWANLFEKLAPSLATGTAPELLLMGCEYIPEYAENGGIISIEEFWEWSGLERSNYDQTVQDIFKYKGNYYGIPMQYNTMYLYWNKDLFKEAGLDPEKPPKTFDELKEYAGLLTKKEKQQYGFGIATASSNITNFLWSNGGDWLNEEQTEAACNSPEMIEVLRMLQDFALNGVTPVGMSGAELDNLLLAGQLAMYINGPWLINGCRHNNLNFGIGAVPAANNGNLQVPAGGCAYMVTSSASEEEKIAAFECIKYWLSKDVLKKWSLKNGFPVWSREVLEDEEIKNDEIQSILGPLNKYGRLPFAEVPEYSRMTNEYLDPLFEQLMYGQISPEECAKKMADGINTVLKGR